MSSVGIFSGHIQKLGHPIKEIRERALKNLSTKIKYGFEFDDQLARTRELLKTLLAWFQFDNPSCQKEVLSLLHTIIKSKTGSNLVKELGITELVDNLTSISNKLDPDARITYENVLETLNFARSVQSDHDAVPTLHLPSLYSTTVDDGKAVSSLRSDPVENDSDKLPDCIKVYLLPWCELCTSDMKTLTLIEDALLIVRSTKRCCRFIVDVFIRDFPAEIFLNRPVIVKKLHSMLSSHRGGHIMEVLLAITKAIDKRIDQLNDPAFKMSPRKCNFDGCKSQSLCSEMEEFARTLNSHAVTETDKQADKMVAALNQMSVPAYCLTSIVNVLSALGESLVMYKGDAQFNMYECNTAFKLVEHLMSLFTKCVTSELWNCEHNSKLLMDIVQRLYNIMRLLGELLDKFRISFATNPNLVCMRVCEIQVLALSAILLEWCVSTSPVSPGFITSLENSLSDVAITVNYPLIVGRLMKVFQKSTFNQNHEFTRKYREVTRLCTSMEYTTKVMREPIEDSPNILKLILKSLPSLEIHKSKSYVQQVLDVLFKMLRNFKMDDSLWSEARKICLYLMAYHDISVREEFYKMAANVVLCVTTKKSRSLYDEESLLLLFDVGILTEICCHGVTSSSKAISHNSKEILLYLIRGKLMFSDKCWWHFLSCLLPTMPLLMCHAKHDDQLGEAIVRMLDSRISECMLIPTVDIIACNIRVTYVKCYMAQMDASHNLCSMLHLQEDSDNYLPTMDNIRGDLLIGALRNVTPRDFNVSHSRVGKEPQFSVNINELLKIGVDPNDIHTVSGLLQILNILKRDVQYDPEEPTFVCRIDDASDIDLDPSYRRTTLQQLAVMMQQPNMHELFVEHDGLYLVCVYLRLSLMVNDYLVFPECVLSCISILNSVSSSCSHARHVLCKHQHLYLLIIRAILVYISDVNHVTLCSQLLYLLTHTMFIIQDFDVNNMCILALPHVLTEMTNVPFECNSYWKTSSHTAHPVSAWILEDEKWKSFVRLHWTCAWHGGIDKIIKWPYVPEMSENDDYAQYLTLTEKDLTIVKNTSPVESSKQLLYKIQNSTTHKGVEQALYILSGSVSILRHAFNSRDSYYTLQWSDTLSRYLHSMPASPKDVTLLLHVLNFIYCYLDTVVTHDKSRKSTEWILQLLIEQDDNIVDLLKRRRLHPQQTSNDTAELTQLQTTIVRLLSCCVALMDGEDSGHRWDDIVQVLVECLDDIDLKDFHMLGYLNELVKCLQYIMNSKCDLTSGTMLSATETLVNSIRASPRCKNNYSGFKGEVYLQHVYITLIVIINRLDSIGIPPQSWSSMPGWTDTISSLCKPGQGLMTRAAGLSLLTELVQRVHLIAHIEQAFDTVNIRCIDYVIHLVADENEAAIVREQACYLLAALSPHHEGEIDYLLNSSNFLQVLIKILNRYCYERKYEDVRINNGTPLELLENKDTYEVLLSKGEDIRWKLNTWATGRSEVTPGLVMALTSVMQSFITMESVQFLENWNEEGIFRLFFRSIQGAPPRHTPWFEEVSLGRDLFRIAMRLRTGHMPLNEYGFLMKEIQSPNCTKCKIREDIHHLLVACERGSGLNDELIRRCLYSRDDGVEHDVHLCSSICQVLSHCVCINEDIYNTLVDTHDCVNILLQIVSSIKSEGEYIGSAHKLFLRNALMLLGGLCQCDKGGLLVWKQIHDAFIKRFFIILIMALNDTERELHLSVFYCLTQLMQALPSYKKHLERTKMDIEFFEDFLIDGVRLSNDHEFGQGDFEMGVCSTEFLSEELCQIIIERFSSDVSKIDLQKLSSNDYYVCCCGALSSLISHSARARGSATRLLPILCNMLTDIRNNLSLQGKSVQTITNVHKCPILQTLHSVTVLIGGVITDNIENKEHLSELYVHNSLTRLWPWYMCLEPLRTSILQLLCNFTNGCNKALFTMPMTVGQNSLVTEICHLLSKEMSTLSHVKSVSIAQYCLEVLANCASQNHCRSLILKSEVLSFLNKLHPAVSKRRAVWKSLERPWENFLEQLSRHTDAQHSLLDYADVLCALVQQTECCMIHVLANCAFNHNNRTKILTSTDIVHTFQHILSLDGNIEAKVAVCRAVWSLAANNYKAKLTLRSLGITSSIRECLTILKHPVYSSTEIQKAIELFSYTYGILAIT